MKKATMPDGKSVFGQACLRARVQLSAKSLDARIEASALVDHQNFLTEEFDPGSD